MKQLRHLVLFPGPPAQLGLKGQQAASLPACTGCPYSLPQVYVTSSRSHHFQWATVHTVAPLLPHFLAFCSCGAGMGVRQYWGTCWCHWHPQDTVFLNSGVCPGSVERASHIFLPQKPPGSEARSITSPRNPVLQLI